jgi:uncharacterized protein (TIRG00374 family)
VKSDDLKPPVTDPTVTPVAPSRRRAILRRILEASISLIFLVLALRGIDLAVLWRGIRSAQLGWLVASALFTVALLFLKAWRWQLLFLPEYHVRYSSAFTAMSAGYLVSNVLPARMGELARLVLIVSDEQVSAVRTFSTIIVERLLDILSLLAIMVMILPFVNLPVPIMRGAQGLGLVALLGAASLVLASFWKERLMRWAHAILGRVRFLDRAGIYAAIEHLIDGFAALRGRLGVIQIVLSFVAWAGVIAMAWTAAKAVGLQAPITAIIITVVITTLGMLVPSSPGYIGVFEYLATVALGLFAVPKAEALTFAIV